MTPLLSGGTGSLSHTEAVPDFLPDRFEPGTMNLPGILGLRAGLLWLRETGIAQILSHELALTAQFLRGLAPMEADGKIKLAGLRGTAGRTGVVSIQTPERELSEVAYQLDSRYGIMTRVGLHCAPAAHRTLGTFPRGTVRVSLGWFTTVEEVDRAVEAIGAVAKG